MTTRTFRLMIAMTLFAALAIPVGLTAQDNAAKTNKPMHHHYQLIDMGTLGGPNSSINHPFFEGTLNRRGVTIGWSATSASTSPTSRCRSCACPRGWPSPPPAAS